MSRESFNPPSKPEDWSSHHDQKPDRTSPLYGRFFVPFVRSSQTVKRPQRLGQINHNVLREVSPSSSSSSLPDLSQRATRKLESPMVDPEQCLNFQNKYGIGSTELIPESSIRRPQYSSKEELPHPSQLSTVKRKRPQTTKQTATRSVINEHLSQLQRKHHLLTKTKPLESALVTRDQVQYSSNSCSATPMKASTVPSVVIETTKQCIMTFGSDATFDWTRGRANPISSTNHGRQMTGCYDPSVSSVMETSSNMTCEGLVANVRSKIVCRGGGDEYGVFGGDRRPLAPNWCRGRGDEYNGLGGDQRPFTPCQEFLLPQETSFDHFLYLYQKNSEQLLSADDDYDGKENFDSIGFSKNLNTPA